MKAPSLPTVLRRRPAAFTLIEMLVVIAIIATLTSLLIPAFGNVGKSASLTAAGNQIVSVLHLARANAMSRNAMTAVVLINTETSPNDPSRGTSHRAVVVMELAPKADGTPLASSDWRQISRVEELRPGAVVDPENAFKPSPSEKVPASLGGANKALPASLPAIRIRGQSVSIENCPRIVFMPNGSLFDGHCRTAKLMQGYLQDGKLQETTATGNYYEVVVLASSGRTKIDRP